MLIWRVALLELSVGLLLLGAGLLSAQDYPKKPIRIVTGTVESGADSVTRFIAQGISGPLGQPAIVDNRSGYISGEIVSKALPDGYTLLIVGNNFFYGPLLQDVPYDPVKDFAPISLIGTAPQVLLVSLTLSVNSVRELIELARSKPGMLNYASAQTGGSGHLTAELFKSMAGVNIVRVAYKGTVFALPDLMSGQVQIMFENPPVVLPLMKAGKLKGLAVTSLRPTVLAPGLPTIAETLPQFEMVATVSMFAPAKTPGAIITRLTQEVVRFLKTPEAKEKLLSVGYEEVGSSPKELATWMQTSVTLMGKVIKDAGIKIE